MIDYGTGGAPVLMARNLAAAKKSWNWNFAKTKRGASGGFLPRPLLLRLRHPNSEKRNQPKFCGILSPENCFRKTSSALFRHLPEYLEGRTPKEKHSFLPPRALRVRSVGIGVAFKIHSKFKTGQSSNFVQKAPQ